ncbi:hemerythrin domain-containing protein [Geothrix campi]|uniref:hemerythrin domain-containing protein n=1 Tax=Geothrix campi TaxID=2966450 RepID=UPI002147BC40|nr:hemerythrin domain-containing protein [Geothrix sp. SG10]
MTPPDPLLAIALALVALGLLDRLGLWMEARGWIYWRRRSAQGSALGSTFLELQKIFESGKAEHIIEAMNDGRKEAQDSLAAKLAADHREIDHLYREARAAVEQRLQAEAHRALDRIWMRLAVHIRAEHKALFPAVAAARPDLGATLQALREDHDFFMATLAGTVKALEGAEVEWATVRSALEAVHRRLASHNTLEEERIYPLVDQFPDEQRRQLVGDVSRELALLPARYEES